MRYKISDEHQGADKDEGPSGGASPNLKQEEFLANWKATGQRIGQPDKLKRDAQAEIREEDQLQSVCRGLSHIIRLTFGLSGAGSDV